MSHVVMAHKMGSLTSLFNKSISISLFAIKSLEFPSISFRISETISFFIHVPLYMYLDTLVKAGQTSK